MSDDLKERLQKHDWKYLTARIEALEAQLADSRKALRTIASRTPRRENSVHGQRWRCPACDYASQSSDEPPRHAAHCDAEIARASLPKDPSTGSGS